MLKRYQKIVGTKDFEKFERKSELHESKATCSDGHEVVYQDSKGNLFHLNNFLYTERVSNGKSFSDGSRLLIKNWMKIIRIGDCYQLFPMNGSFGFCHGPNAQTSALYDKICNKEKLESKKEDHVSYLVDDSKNIIYEVHELIFDNDPMTFDLFDGAKQIVIFKGRNEFGFVHRGQFHPHDARAKTTIHPIAAWWLDQI